MVGQRYVSLGLAIVIFGVACAHAWKAVRRKYADHFDAGPDAMAIIHPVSIAGLLARGFVEPLDHAIAGRQSTMGAPFRFASVDHWLKRAAPLLGQHNREILHELGLADDEIAELERDQVIGDWPEGL